MSYVALATARFEEMTAFYGSRLGFPVVETWDRTRARGKVFDLRGLRLEILDNRRESRPLALGDPDERVHLVVEVEDLDAFRAGLAIATPEPAATTWGVRLIRLADPDGIPVTILERVD